MKRMFVCVISVLIGAYPSFAEIHMPPMFGDGMVLQREQKVPIWGWGETGAKVEVSFALQKVETTVNDGKWMVWLNPLEGSEKPAEMIVRVGQEEFVIKDVVVGEVWLCSGQSNMEITMDMRDAKDPMYQPIVEYINEEMAKANDEFIRQIKVRNNTSPVERIKDFEGVWVKAVPGSTQNIKAVGYYFAKELRKELKVPVGLLNCSWGATRIEPWIPADAYTHSKNLQTHYDELTKSMSQEAVNIENEALMAKWQNETKKATEENKRPPARPKLKMGPDKNNAYPATLFNAMVNPFIPYAVKGALWYQGESNEKNFPEMYEILLSALINSWRENWGQDKFYFYWCQLASFKSPNIVPTDEISWVTVQDNQRRALKIKDTGMAVLNDIGEAGDIHPRNKVDAGKRLSLWALHQAYGKDIVFSGPLFKEAKINNGKFIIKFDSVGTGLMIGEKHLLDPVVKVDKPLKHFQICGEDRQWKWAKAEITSKDEVTVWNDDIAKPVEVRYAWSSNPEGAKLYNQEGLPASAFKTE